MNEYTIPIVYDEDAQRWYSPIINRIVTVDGKIRIRHIANAIMKQAGIERNF